MDLTKAAKHEHQRPTPTRQVPQGRASGPGQPEHVFESSPPWHRYLGNNYVEAMTSKKQRLGLQTKFKINEVGDSYEREADRVADQVLATAAHHDISGAPPRIQCLSEQSHGQVDAAPASVDQALAGPGRSLQLALQQDMEECFGYDFSNVRVHTGAVAEQSAQDVNANAYTVGHNIVFDTGRFAPETHAGRSLLAHELTHVVHQAGRGVPTIQRKEKEGQQNSLTVTQITVEPKTIGRGRGTALTSDGQTLAIDIEVNNLSAGRVTTGKPLQEPQSDGWSRIHLGSMHAKHLVYLLPPGVTVAQNMTIVVEPAFRERQLKDQIKPLAPHIQNFLMKNTGALGSYEDLQSVVNAGFLLEVAGVTEDELELSLMESPKTETSDLVSWAQDFLVRRQEQEESEKKHEERERQREAEEKELEKWRKRFEKYPDALLEKKIAELRAEPGSASAKDWLPRYEKERARRRDVRRAKPVTRPETVDQAVSMLEEAWRDAEKEDVPDVKRALELVSCIDEWLQETASSDKYDKYFEGLFRTVVRQTVGITKEQIRGIRYKLQSQGEDDWNRRTHLGGHWELGINSLKYAREHLEVMGGKKSLQETSLHGLQQTTTRVLKYEAAGYAIVVAAPVVIGAAIKAAPFVTTEAMTAGALRVAPRLMFWAGRNPILATAIGTGVVETALQVGQDKYLDPFQLIFSLLHIYMAMPGRGTPAPNAPRPEGEPDFIIGQPKVDQQTGKVTASAIEKATGRHFDAEVDITTGTGRITDGKTGAAVLGNINLNTGDVAKPTAAGPVTSPITPPKSAAPAAAIVAPAVTLTAKQGGGQGSGTPIGMLRDVDVPGGGVQVSASHPVFKNKLAANDVPPPQAQAATGTVNAQADVPHGQIIGAAQQPTAPGQKNVAPVLMAAKPPPSNPAGQPVGSPTTTPPVSTSGPTTPRSGPSEGQTHRAHPRLLPRTPAQEAPPSPTSQLPAEQAPPPSGATGSRQTASPDDFEDAPTLVRPRPEGQTHRAHPRLVPRAPAQEAPPSPTSQLPAEQAPPPSAATGSRQPGLPDDFEDAPTLVSPLQPADPDYEPSRSLVRRSGRDTDQNLRSVTGEITEPPSGPETAPTAGSAGARLATRDPVEPQTHSPQPPVREPAVSSEASAPAPVSKTPQKLERFDFLSLPVPEQYRNAKDKVQVFGTEVINWGAGPEGAQGLTTMLRTNPEGARAYIENLRRVGVTREMARAWADFYRHEHERAKDVSRTYGSPMNKTPESRVTLLDLIATLL